MGLRAKHWIRSWAPSKLVAMATDMLMSQFEALRFVRGKTWALLRAHQRPVQSTSRLQRSKWTFFPLKMVCLVTSLKYINNKKLDSAVCE